MAKRVERDRQVQLAGGDPPSRRARCCAGHPGRSFPLRAVQAVLLLDSTEPGDDGSGGSKPKAVAGPGPGLCATSRALIRGQRAIRRAGPGGLSAVVAWVRLVGYDGFPQLVYVLCGEARVGSRVVVDEPAPHSVGQGTGAHCVFQGLRQP